MDQERRIQLALEAIRNKSVPSIRKAADLFQVNRSTLQNRLNGATDHKSAHQPFQRLSAAEEASLERTILLMSIWGWPMTIKNIEAFATQLLQAKGDLAPLGHNWYKSFLARHPELKTQRSRTLDQSRKDASDPKVLQEWFWLYQRVRLSWDIAEEDIYNMDEKGCMKGVGDNAKVIVSKYDKEAFSNQPGNRDWVSIIECIGINGYILPPFVIFQGQRLQESWVDDCVDKKTVIQVSPNGWTDQEIALTWLRHFDHYTKSQVRGEYRLLILDGHTSHTSLEFVRYCEEHKIIPLCLPPHSTHILQPLDVGIFSALAKAYRSLVQQGSIFGATRIDNKQFLLLYQQARRTIAPNIPGAWRGAGLYPYNPSKILEKYRPKTPPFSNTADKSGAGLQGGDDMAQKINSITAEILQVCPTPLRSQVDFVKDVCLTALADKTSLQLLNEGLVKKQQEVRGKKTKKYFGSARVLRTDEMIAKQKEREALEAEQAAVKARKDVLRGKVGFVKQVWKEFKMGNDVFT